MSEFKYACPHCGQHIRCDAAQSGTQMECPTCFQKIVAPQAPAGGDAKFILTGSKLPKARPGATAASSGAAAGESPRKKFPLGAIIAVVVVGAAVAAGVMFREKIFKPTPAAANPAPENPAPVKTPAGKPPAPKPAPADDANWTLALAAVDIPAAPAAGRLNGAPFTCDRATLTGGSLVLRQGNAGPLDFAFVINLHAVRSADLAGQSIAVAPEQSPAPRVVLRWKNEQQTVVPRVLNGGYALRLEFGALAGGKLPGKIYLCTPDAAKSYIAGSFTANIVAPKPPGPVKKKKP